MLSLSPFLKPIPLSPLTQGPQFHGHTLSSKPLSKPLLAKACTTNPSSTANGAVAEEDFRVLTATRSEHNNIVILESQTSKVLLLDDSGNVHSILYKGTKWTNSYWDEFTSLPAIIPTGPVAIFGLGGGTVAHQLLHFWPSLCVHGWELDEVLLDRARQFFGLSELEMSNASGGVLQVYGGDALSAVANVEGVYAGIVVDLFADGKVLPELEKAETWLAMREKLMPDGRIMVNCGAASISKVFAVDRGWEANLTIQAMCKAFGGGSVNWKMMPQNESGNYLAFTGPLPDISIWSPAVPEKLVASVELWRACEP